MTNGESSAATNERNHEGCADCDPGLLDDLKCQAAGIQQQADYNAAHGPELDGARTAFAAARGAYNEVRGKAEPLVAKARHQLEELEDRVRCQLDGADAGRIERAWWRIVERLDRCGHERGCCCDEPCDFDEQVREVAPEDVPGRLAMIESRTKEASECFWSLIGEYTVVSAPAPPTSPNVPAAPTAPAAPAPVATAGPAAAATPAIPAAPATVTPAPPPAPLAALPARVKAMQDEIEAISKAAAEGSWDPPTLYAAVLVARRHLKDVWRGFVNVNEYMDCLCQALTCMIKGHAAIGELIRLCAVELCFRESWKAGCKYLEDNTVDEVLAEYLRVCAEEIVGVPDPGLDSGRDRDQGRDGPRPRGPRERRDPHDRDDRGQDDHEDRDDQGDQDDHNPGPDRPGGRGRDGSERPPRSRYPYRDDRGRFTAP